MRKLYDYRTANQIIIDTNNTHTKGACAGAVCLWLQQRSHGQPLMEPPNLAAATALQQILNNIAPMMYEQRNASLYVAFKLYVIGFQVSEEIGTKGVINLLNLIRQKPGLYYLSLPMVGGGLHAMRLHIHQGGGYYLFDPDDGLIELSFNELVEHLFLECEDEDQFVAMQIS